MGSFEARLGLCSEVHSSSFQGRRSCFSCSSDPCLGSSDLAWHSHRTTLTSSAGSSRSSGRGNWKQSRSHRRKSILEPRQALRPLAARSCALWDVSIAVSFLLLDSLA